MNILPDCLSIHQIIGLDGLRSQQKTPCPHYAAEDTEQDHRCECIERNGGHETQPDVIDALPNLFSSVLLLHCNATAAAGAGLSTDWLSVCKNCAP